MITSGYDTLQWWTRLEETYLVEVLRETENVGRMYITQGGPFGVVVAGGVPVPFSNGDGNANATDALAWEATAKSLLGH